MPNQHTYGHLDFDQAAKMLASASMLSVANRVLVERVEENHLSPTQFACLLSRSHLLEAEFEGSLHLLLNNLLKKYSLPLLSGNSDKSSLLTAWNGVAERSELEQIDILMQFFPKLASGFRGIGSQTLKRVLCPSELYRYQLFPHWSLLDNNYTVACASVLEKLADSQPNTFVNLLRDNNLCRITESFQKEDAWKRAMRTSNEKYIFIPVQPGKKYCQYPPESVVNSISDSEMPLGVYEVGLMLLTYSEILSNSDQLWIDCPGDFVMDASKTSMKRFPIFDFDGEHLRIRTRYANEPNPRSGSATGYICPIA